MTLFFEKELHNALFQELSMPRLYEKRISSYTDIGPFNSNRELLILYFKSFIYQFYSKSYC
ncbi:conserved hypothetical protein [delta proteobacterium NaphS2]|nr:conserved hypothetical protein [delta proteobacterium NaphS2]